MEDVTDPEWVNLSVARAELKQKIFRAGEFPQELFSDFLDSSNHTGDLECDIRCFIDEYKDWQSLDELPECELMGG